MRFRIRTGVSRTAPLLLLFALISCSGAVPNSAIPDNLAERRYGIRTATTPLVALIHDYNLYSPDPASAVPLLDQMQRELAKSDPNGRQRGITFDLTRGNRLDRDWIVQCPGRWRRCHREMPGRRHRQRHSRPREKATRCEDRPAEALADSRLSPGRSASPYPPPPRSPRRHRGRDPRGYAPP